MAVQHRTRHCRWLQRWAYRPSSSTRRDARLQVRLSLETIIAIGDNQSLRMARPITGSETHLKRSRGIRLYFPVRLNVRLASVQPLDSVGATLIPLPRQ